MSIKDALLRPTKEPHLTRSHSNQKEEGVPKRLRENQEGSKKRGVVGAKKMHKKGCGRRDKQKQNVLKDGKANKKDHLQI